MTPGVLGIDPSLTATGVADPDGNTYTIKTKAKDGDYRLIQIFQEISSEASFGVRYAVIEDLPTHAMSAGKTGMSQGVVRAALCDWNIPFVTVPPATLKKYATGKGNADKAAMALALKERTGLELADDNQVDAWWLRAIGLQLLRFPCVNLPQSQVDALGKLKVPAGWPT